MPTYYIGGISASSNDLFHYGVVGMKWGVRRYQNPDGSYTTAGKKRYKTFSQLKKDYPGLDYGPTFPQTDRYGGLTDREIDQAFREFEQSPQYEIMRKSQNKLNSKVTNELKDKVKKLYDLKQEKVEKIRKDYNKKYNIDSLIKEAHKIEDSYIEKSLSELPNLKRFSKKEKAIARDKGAYEAHKDQRYGEIKDQIRNAAKEFSQVQYKMDSKYRDRAYGEALKHLGYKNTKEARAYIYYITLWDF